MTGPETLHVAGVVAVWVITLSSIRLSIASGRSLWPLIVAAWHLVRCRERDRQTCRLRLFARLDSLHIQLFAALTQPLGAPLLFGGMLLIGLGLSVGSIGDVAQLVASRPKAIDPFDRSMDCIAAGLVCGGMAMALAAVSTRRLWSTLISTGFVVTGLGIGLVIVAHP